MDIDVGEVEKTMAISQAYLSLDAPVIRGESNQLLDYLTDVHDRGSDADAIDHSLAESIDACFRQLREREAVILRLYFGLDSPEPLTLEEIGARLGITRERVRQIKEKALQRLRNQGHAEVLEAFLT